MDVRLHGVCCYVYALLLITGSVCNRAQPLSNELEQEKSDLDNVDPQGSWMSFVQHSDRTDKKRPSHKFHKLKGRRHRSHLPGPAGPPGQQGPPGPAGPPGALVTRESLMTEFKQLVQEEAERRAEVLMVERCPECEWVSNATLPLIELGEVNVVPRVTAGFHQRLRANTVISKRTLAELAGFLTPFGGGSFQRGNVFNPLQGRFTAPRPGIYQFTVNVHIVHDGLRSKKARRLRHSDNVRVSICIQGLCQKHTSLENISGLESNSRSFTITVTGLLYLEAGQYTSIYVDNGSARALTVLEGSDFSGVLLGT